MERVLALLRLPPADRPAPGWHTSALVDLVAYQFSWVWILVPLALAGDLHPKDYLGIWAVGMTLSFVHRHYTMPYVYLDKLVFSQHVARFTLFSGLLMLACLASGFLMKWRAPAGFFRAWDVALVVTGLLVVAQALVMDRRGHRFSARAMLAVAAPFALAVALGIGGLFAAHHGPVAAVVLVAFAAAAALAWRDDGARATRATPLMLAVLVAAATGLTLVAVDGSTGLNSGVVRGSALVGLVGVFAATWNVWHTMMQKFGILRVYSAKSTVALERRTPPWVDRLLVFSWFPFLALWVGPAQRDVLATQYKSVTQHLLPVVDVLAAAQVWLLGPAGALVLFALGAFIVHEHRADGLKNVPRLSMAAALTLLNACFLFVAPLKVYMAYGFSHAVEYMVFVWAFQRRRYAAPLPHKPLLQRALQRPWLAYAAFTLPVAGGFFLIEFGDDYGLHQGGLRLFDVKVGTWLFVFAIWHSMVHFWFDGFLWKMRLPAVRASL